MTNRGAGVVARSSSVLGRLSTSGMRQGALRQAAGDKAFSSGGTTRWGTNNTAGTRRIWHSQGLRLRSKAATTTSAAAHAAVGNCMETWHQRMQTFFLSLYKSCGRRRAKAGNCAPQSVVHSHFPASHVHPATPAHWARVPLGKNVYARIHQPSPAPPTVITAPRPALRSRSRSG